jgi:hypothetical protein
MVSSHQIKDQVIIFFVNYSGNYRKRGTIKIILLYMKKRYGFVPLLRKRKPGKWTSKLTYVLLLSFAFYDLILLFNILVLKAIIVESNIMSARPFYRLITESSRKGPKHEILNPRKGGYRTLVSWTCFLQIYNKRSNLWGS